MIYVSFPGDPDIYPAQATYNPEKAHHIYYGLKNRYKEVELVKFYQAPHKFEKKDVLVTEVFANYKNLDRSRIILVDNANFENNKYFYPDKARYTKHGINSENEIDGNRDAHVVVKDIGNILLLSNDVAIQKYKTNHPDILDYKNVLKGLVGNIDMAPHPLDKQRYLKFFDDRFIAKPRMLIYHAGMRKNSSQFVDMVKSLGYREREHWVQSPYWNKNDHQLLKNINNDYHMLVSCSYSETGPAHMLESMYQGLLILGHEEWWNAYSYNKTLWSYDPTRYQEMKENVSWLMDSKNLDEIKQMRNHIVNISVNRKDNEWPYLLNKLFTMVDSLI